MSGAGALTYNLPHGVWGALLGEAGARYGPHSLWLGMLFTPEREIPFWPGSVTVTAIGGQLRACTLLFGTGRIRADGCAVGLLLSLRADADHFTKNDAEVRPWWLAGAGGELAFLPAPWLAAGFAGRLLIAPKKEEFSIVGLDGPAYETKPVLGWLGLSLSAKIW